MTNQNPMTLPVYSDQAISRMFCDYVDSTNCKERHTAAAVRDYDVFADYVENETRSSNTVQNALLEKAMDFAVEYEESGFIAGFRWAVMMFLHGAPEPPAEAPERASEPPTRKLLRPLHRFCVMSRMTGALTSPLLAASPRSRLPSCSAPATSRLCGALMSASCRTSTARPGRTSSSCAVSTPSTRRRPSTA